MGHRASDLFNGHRGIDPVLVEKIDVVGAEAFQGTLDGFTDVFRPAVDSRAFAVLDLETKFRGQDHLFPPSLQRTAEEFFVGEGAVDLSGIEKRAAELDRAMNRGDGFGIIRRPVSLAHPHAAQADFGNFQSLRAQFSFS